MIVTVERFNPSQRPNGLKFILHSADYKSCFVCIRHRACERGAWVERKTERSGPKIGWIGAERWAAVAKNDGAGAKCRARSGRSRSGNGTGSGLNRQLTARSSLTIHWLHNVYNYTPHSTAVNSISLHINTVFLLMHLPCHLFEPGPVQHYTHRPQPKAFLTRPNPSHRHDAF